MNIKGYQIEYNKFKYLLKNDLKKDDRKEKISSINIDMKGAANKINDQDEQESRFVKWASLIE